MENTEVTKIPFETTRVPNGDKPKGFEEVVSDGVDGTRTVVTIDGHVTSDRTIAPKNEVVFYGTKEEGEDGDTLSSGDASDNTISQSVEPVSTPESPQEEVEKQPSQNDETVSNPSGCPKDCNCVPVQGSYEQDGGKKGLFSMKSETLKKAALEAGRLLVFAVPGILITVLTNNPELGGSLGATILLVLKSLDRGIHEDKTVEANGLLPF